MTVAVTLGARARARARVGVSAHLGRVDAQMPDDRADLSDVAHALAVLVEERERLLDHLLHLQRARRLAVPIAVPSRSRRHPRNDTTRVGYPRRASGG